MHLIREYQVLLFTNQPRIYFHIVMVFHVLPVNSDLRPLYDVGIITGSGNLLYFQNSSKQYKNHIDIFVNISCSPFYFYGNYFQLFIHFFFIYCLGREHLDFSMSYFATHVLYDYAYYP